MGTTGSSPFSVSFEPYLRQGDAARLAGRDLKGLQETLGYRFKDGGLLEEALCHSSFANEHGLSLSNERLEFLGDSVLGLVVTEYLYRAHPTVPEGQLAKMRAATVSEPALAAVARDLGVGEFIKLGKGEALSGGRDKDSILSDTVEALIGATYLTHGLEETRTVVTRLVSRFLDSARTRGAGLDWKTSLQELTAVHQLGNPAYKQPTHSAAIVS